MAKTYFISDAHLGLGTKEEERAKERRLIGFLDHICLDAEQLFIVGDLFDAWFEYRTVIPKGFHRFFAKVSDLTDRGMTIHYLAGNHDYWMRDFFRDELGMKTHYEPFEVQIDGKKVYIHHGDGLAANDTGYRILKKVLRGRLNVWLYSWLHPDIGLTLAKSTSKRSRRHTGGKNYGESDTMQEFARQKMNEGYDVIVMGHRHKPVFQQIGQGIYINLGDWIEHNTFAEMDRGRIALKTWTP
ncbi:MAG: UDP-2,3-diacylglucosamine diphosphatase [Ignavibacteriae bacterium]|nr:UDP-2,3-diacylglucosamine diphosphatase [Ignavibacteria bacterium]MBI3364743.1 UDP-2,3-diacylglucosamine diphosphatase [Ignavibacteriota bacterium]